MNINKENPLVVILSKRLTFLNKTIQSVLEYHQMAFEVRDEGKNKLMGYTLPIICFEDIVFEKGNVIELLADVCFGGF